MTMTIEEIVRSYRQSKTPLKQIGILADLNQCSKQDIVAILDKAGQKLPQQFDKKPKKAQEPEPEAPAVENAKPEPAAEPVKKLTVEQTCMEMIRQLLAIADHAKNKETAAQDFVQRASGVLMVAEGLRR